MSVGAGGCAGRAGGGGARMNAAVAGTYLCRCAGAAHLATAVARFLPPYLYHLPRSSARLPTAYLATAGGDEPMMDNSGGRRQPPPWPSAARHAAPFPLRAWRGRRHLPAARRGTALPAAPTPTTTTTRLYPALPRTVRWSNWRSGVLRVVLPAAHRTYRTARTLGGDGRWDHW